MNKTIVFAKRNFKELHRDLLTLIFTIFLPVVIFLIILYISKQIDIPNTAFSIENFTPSTIIFSFSFLTLFSAMLVSKDVSTAFLTRLFTSPLKSSNFIIGYILPLIIISIIQNIILFLIAILFGLEISINIVFCIIATIPIAIMFSAIGILFGSIFNDKQASGVTSVIIQVVAFTSGMWFDLNMIGGAFKTISYILPFSHCVDILKKILQSNFDNILVSVIVVIGYGILFVFLSILAFKNKNKR